MWAYSIAPPELQMCQHQPVSQPINQLSGATNNLFNWSRNSLLLCNLKVHYCVHKTTIMFLP
jgi:hypothetical protein